LYALFGGEERIAVPQQRDYRRALWEDVLKNKTVFSLVAVLALCAPGQNTLSAVLSLHFFLRLKISPRLFGPGHTFLYFFSGVAHAFVGWIADRFGHKALIAAFSVSSVVVIVAIPYLGSGPLLPVALAALGALLWALRPVIVTAAMEAAPQNLTGSIVAVIYGANMGVSFLAPLMAGFIAGAFCLPSSPLSISVFPPLPALGIILLFMPPRA